MSLLTFTEKFPRRKQFKVHIVHHHIVIVESAKALLSLQACKVILLSYSIILIYFRPFRRRNRKEESS